MQTTLSIIVEAEQTKLPNAYSLVKFNPLAICKNKLLNAITSEIKINQILYGVEIKGATMLYTISATMLSILKAKNELDIVLLRCSSSLTFNKYLNDPGLSLKILLV